MWRHWWCGRREVEDEGGHVAGEAALRGSWCLDDLSVLGVQHPKA